jgi:Ca-activated chloride channel family protein
MSFAWPALLSLAVVPIALLLWEVSHRRRVAAQSRPKILRAEAGARSLKLSAFSTQAGTPAARPRYWLCAGLVLAVVALARPQWGRLEEPVFDQSREILLAVDLSRSMLTPDVKPSRLERAKLLIQSLLEKLKGERVGLVVFSGTAFLQSPLSADYEILREFLPALGPDFLPAGGSNYGALLDTSLQAFGATNAADRFLVVLSDGEATDEDWRSRLPELKNKNIRVISLGVGTPGGAMIPDGAGGLVKDERGAVVLSKLESATLQELAQASNGAYRDASSWVDVATLVNETIETGRKGEFVEKNTIRLVERFQWPLAFGLWCLCVSFYSEFPVRPRVRDLRIATPDGRKAALPKAAALLALILVLGSLSAVPPALAAATNATPPSPAAPPPPAEPSALAKIVGRLSSADTQTGRDWAELGRETVTWGSRLQSAQQAVPEGPVRDALAAVDVGSKLDPKTADWPKLREELEALLKKPDEKKDEQKDQEQQKNEQEQQQDQQKQDQQKQDQPSQQKQDKSGQPQEQKDGQPKQDPAQNQEQKPQEQKPGESAFGDMSKKEEPPPPPPEDTQKVGGAPEKQPQQKEQMDPALALPLQKLDQLRNQDSPAQLFQLMEGDRKPTKKTGKDW